MRKQEDRAPHQVSLIPFLRRASLGRRESLRGESGTVDIGPIGGLWADEGLLGKPAGSEKVSAKEIQSCIRPSN